MVTIIKQTKYRLAKMWGTVLIGSATMKTNMRDARKKKNKLKIEIPYYPAVPLLGGHLRKMKQTKGTLVDSGSLQYCSHSLSYRITLERITR